MTLGVGVLLAPLGWAVTDHLEGDDAFCVSCHLSEGVALHRDNHADFRAAGPDTSSPTAPVSLAAAHAAAGNEQRGAPFRCIDCHGGVGFVGRTRVKVLSAKDAFWYVVGRFDEPEGMRWPLWDDDCAQCHAGFEPVTVESWESPPFHALAVHNHSLGVGCVECHGAHERGGLTDRNFLHPASVRSQCARCHPEYEETSP